MRRHGFTLIELLVVVSIITLLIAILMPSLSRARYVARVTICASNLHQIDVGMFIYASDNATFLPNMSVMRKYAPRAEFIKISDSDDRPMLAKYFDLNKQFSDPFTPARDYAGTNATQIEIPYSLFCSWQYRNEPDGLHRINDRGFTFRGNRFDIVAGDDQHDYSGGLVIGSHPDQDRLMTHEDLSGSIYRSRWQTYAGTRGLIDCNYAHVDGSVTTLNNLRYQDDRLVWVGEQMADVSNTPPIVRYLPPTR